MSHLWRGTTGVTILALWLSAAGSSLLFAQNPDPNAEQLVIELVNRARHNPQLFDTIFGLGGVLTNPVILPKPPLALNASLAGSARFHAREMAEHDYFDHQSAVTGDWPNKMAQDHGYTFPAIWRLDPNYLNQNYIESIAAGTTTPTQTVNLLLIDEGIVPPGHRIHLLGMDAFFATHDEIGAGKWSNPTSTYGTYWAIHTALDDDLRKFVTGVVYNDGNVDHVYTSGEGLAGVTVEALARGTTNVVGFTTTTASGGYSLPLAAETYDIRFRGGPLAQPVIHRDVAVGGTVGNAKVDSISLWNQSGGGSWNLPASWFGGVPNGVGTTAALASSIQTARTVQLNAPITVGHLRFQSTSGFTIDEGATATDLNLDVAGGSATVQVIGAGQHIINAGVHINDHVTVTIDQGGSLRFTGGRLFNAGKDITKLGAGTLDLDNQLNFDAGSRLFAFAGTTNINFNSGVTRDDPRLSLVVANPGTRVNLNSSHYLDSLTIAGGRVTVTPGGNKVVTVRSLNFEEPAMMIVPEPEAIALLGVGIAMAVLVALAGRRSLMRTK